MYVRCDQGLSVWSMYVRCSQGLWVQSMYVRCDKDLGPGPSGEEHCILRLLGDRTLKPVSGQPRGGLERATE